MTDKKNDVLVVAITGGTGCGQSTVAGFFEKFGAKVINADKIARDIVEHDKEVRQEIRDELGRQYFHRNGKLNRRLLGQAVFADERKLHILNSIVHPRLISNLVDAIEEAIDTGQYKIVAVDAALVYEINMENAFDAVIVVAANNKNRIERIKARDNISEKEVRDRINRQLPVREKARWANFTIYNNHSLKKLEDKSRGVYNQLLRNAKKFTK